MGVNRTKKRGIDGEKKRKNVGEKFEKVADQTKVDDVGKKNT